MLRRAWPYGSQGWVNRQDGSEKGAGARLHGDGEKSPMPNRRHFAWGGRPFTGLPREAKRPSLGAMAASPEPYGIANIYASESISTVPSPAKRDAPGLYVTVRCEPWKSSNLVF